MSDETWRTLHRNASQLLAAGRVQEAIAAYRQLLAANPDLPDSWFNLGWLQRQARAFDEALESYQRALDHAIDKPEEVHLNRAAIYSDYLNRPRDAETELLRALERNPGYVSALVNLGNIREDLGEREPARQAYLRALEIDPDNRLALARLATASLSEILDTELETRLREAIGQPIATASQRAGLGFALAAVLDAAGHYDAALGAAEAANEASRAAAGPNARYDRAEREGFIDRLISTFDGPADPLDHGPAPVFICGMYRSGSTLIEQILAGHSGVIAAGELDLIPTIAANIEGYPEPLATADPSAIARLREFYLAGLPHEPGRQIITDKRPENFLHIGLIKSMFPEAKIVHTVRNPLDNLLSIYFLHLDPSMAYALDLGDAAHWYGQYLRLMDHWRALYGGDILNVEYDALVQEPERIVSGVLKFLDLEWEDSVLDFARTDRAVRTASVWQVREPLYTRSSGRWRNYDRHLQALRDGLAKAGIKSGE